MASMSAITGYILNDVQHLLVFYLHLITRLLHEHINRFVITLTVRLMANLRNRFERQPAAAAPARCYPLRNRHKPDRFMYR